MKNAMSFKISGKAETVFDNLQNMGMLEETGGVVYHGSRSGDEYKVLRIEVPQKGSGKNVIHTELDIRGLIGRYYPDSIATYEWGTFSPRAEILAIALILDATGDELKAFRYKGDFLRRFVFTWNTHWGINREQIRSWVELKEKYHNA